jgi:hypothetical protein
MDFIERFFRISPDDGSGTIEIIWLSAILFVAASILMRRQIISVARRSLFGRAQTLRDLHIR